MLAPTLRQRLGLTILTTPFLLFSFFFTDTMRAEQSTLPLQITKAETFREGDWVFFRLFYDDPNGDAEGFGFRGANGSGWHEEAYPFSSPSFGRVSPGIVEYPFNLLCDTGPSNTSDVEAWIYDRAGQVSPLVTVHLACDATPNDPLFTDSQELASRELASKDILFEDNFDTGIKPGWVINGNNYGSTNGQLLSKGWFNAQIGDSSWHNYAVEFDLKAIDDSFYDRGFRVLIRRQSDTSYMGFQLERNYSVFHIKKLHLIILLHDCNIQ
jgi:hypothetical protein